MDRLVRKVNETFLRGDPLEEETIEEMKERGLWDKWLEANDKAISVVGPDWHHDLEEEMVKRAYQVLIFSLALD